LCLTSPLSVVSTRRAATGSTTRFNSTRSGGSATSGGGALTSRPEPSRAPALRPLTEIRNEGDLARLDDVAVNPDATTLFPAHPQGTCRMGEDARRVNDSRGRFHGLAVLDRRRERL
jgi:choline dehydrogenase-like flavoprotein